MINSGLCFTSKWKLGYGYQCGFGYKWMPESLMNFIVKVWNPIACRIFGHDWFPEIDPLKGAIWDGDELVSHSHETCCDCCKMREIGDKK